jgi:methyl-accepting chemotaxis protein
LNDKSLDPAQRTLIAEITLYVHARFWPAFIAVSAILVCHSILISHKIAGPIYRFRLVFRQIAEGNFSDPVQIRKHDYLHEDKDLINEMISSISSKLKNIRAKQYTIQLMFSAFKSKYKAELSDETYKDLSALEDHFHRLEKEMDYFKLDKST